MLDTTNYLGSNSNISKTKHKNYDLKCNSMVYFELFIQMKTVIRKMLVSFRSILYKCQQSDPIQMFSV